MPEEIYMTEDDRALVNGEYVDYEEGETYEVPGWLGRSFKKKGTAVNAASDEAEFDPADERETKPSSTERDQKDGGDPTGKITAEPTTEGSNWYHFRKPDGDLVLNEDEDVLKVQGTENRDDMLEQLNG